MVDDFKSMAAKAKADHDKRMAEMGSRLQLKRRYDRGTSTKLLSFWKLKLCRF